MSAFPRRAPGSATAPSFEKEGRNKSRPAPLRAFGDPRLKWRPELVGFRPTDRVPAPSRARAIAHRAGHSRARRRFCARTFVFFSATMAPITLDMLRRRAEQQRGLEEHLEEISLHQQEIERIENLGQRVAT